MTLLSLQGVTEFQLKSMKCERSIVGWEVRSVGVKCLAHGSSKPHLLLTALPRTPELGMGEKKRGRLSDGWCSLGLRADGGSGEPRIAELKNCLSFPLIFLPPSSDLCLSHLSTHRCTTTNSSSKRVRVWRQGGSKGVWVLAQHTIVQNNFSKEFLYSVFLLLLLHAQKFSVLQFMGGSQPGKR